MTEENEKIIIELLKELVKLQNKANSLLSQIVRLSSKKLLSSGKGQGYRMKGKEDATNGYARHH